jgi:hypothetical protein
MQKRNAWLFFIFTALLFALALVIYWYSETYTSFRIADIDFTVDGNQDVSRIEMLSFADNSMIDLKRDDNNRWMLNTSMFANESAVKELLTVLSGLIVWQPVSISNRDSIHAMLDNEGTLVRVFIHSHRIRFGNFRMFPHETLYQSFVVGDDTPDGESTYMRKQGSNQAFIVRRPGFDTGISYVFEPNERSWRDPVIIDAHWNEIASIRMKITDSISESFVLRNEPGKTFAFYEWENSDQPLIADFDTVLVLRYLSSFKEIYYESLLDEEAEILRKETIFEQPFMVLTVELKDGKQTQVEAFARKNVESLSLIGSTLRNDPNRLYIRINEGEFALAQYYTFNRILRPLSFFKNKKSNTPSN